VFDRAGGRRVGDKRLARQGRAPARSGVACPIGHYKTGQPPIDLLFEFESLGPLDFLAPQVLGRATPDARERIPPMGVVKRGLWAWRLFHFLKCDGVAIFAVTRKVLIWLNALRGKLADQHGSAEGLCLAKP